MKSEPLNLHAERIEAPAGPEEIVHILLKPPCANYPNVWFKSDRARDKLRRWVA